MKEKQKLDQRNTYTPTNAPQIRSNCDHALNRPETISVHVLKTHSNNPNVSLLQPAGGHKTSTPASRFFPTLTDGVSSGGIRWTYCLNY
ncbi:MAG: hypothetical protein M1481_02230 [Candidatus Thermoplasmatota archaeon]|nr:hypothetical protein [Candidatus Thermoplasmatota archaeon]MCL5962763.1 hypothetical protein [Candidatus Thermoplasmatota archaeon]